MSYSCTDFTDTVLDALAIDVPEWANDSPSDQADMVLERLETLQRGMAALKALREWARMMGGWEAKAWIDASAVLDAWDHPPVPEDPNADDDEGEG